MLSSLVVIPGIAGAVLRKPFPPPLRQCSAEAKTEENPQRTQTIHNCSPRFSFPTKQALSLKVYTLNIPKPKHYKHKRQLFKKQKVKRWENLHKKKKKTLWREINNSRETSRQGGYQQLRSQHHIPSGRLLPPPVVPTYGSTQPGTKKRCPDSVKRKCGWLPQETQKPLLTQRWSKQRKAAAEPRQEIPRARETHRKPPPSENNRETFQFFKCRE